MLRLTTLIIGLTLILFGFSTPVVPQAETPSLHLTSIMPDPATQSLVTQAPITFSFNAPLNCDTIESAFSITPDVQGFLTCMNTQMMFVPTDDYIEQMAYAVTITTELRSSTGERLNDTLEATFYSEGFLRITELLPANGTAGIAVDTDFTVVFDRPVIPLSTSVDFDERPVPIRTEPLIVGSGEWINTFIYRFTPDALLEPGTDYTVIVDNTFAAVDGSV